MKNVNWSLLICAFIAILCIVVFAFDFIIVPVWGQLVIAGLLLVACVVSEFLKNKN